MPFIGTLQELYALDPERVGFMDCDMCSEHILVSCDCKDGAIDHYTMPGSFKIECKHCGMSVSVSKEDQKWWLKTLLGVEW